MHVILRPILWITAILFVLLIVVSNFPSSSPMFVVAYTGQCTGPGNGTCLKEINSGQVLYWADYNRRLNGWSADMQYNVYRNPSDSQLYSYSRADGKLTQLTPADNIQRFVPALSPDSKTVAYAASGTNSNSIEIRTLDLATKTEVTVAYIGFTGMRFSNELQWSPDGKHIVMMMRNAYNSYGVRDARVAVLNMETGDITELGSALSDDVMWSPTGQHVAFADANTDTYSVIDIKTGESLPVLPHDGNSGAPAGYSYYSSDATFSADGSQMAFVSRDYVDNVTNVRVRDLATGEEKVVASLPNADTRFEDVVWKEDGIWLMEDRIGSPSADLVVFHHVDPETGKRTETGTLFAEDYAQVAEW